MTVEVTPWNVSTTPGAPVEKELRDGHLTGHTQDPPTRSPGHQRAPILRCPETVGPLPRNRRIGCTPMAPSSGPI